MRSSPLAQASAFVALTALLACGARSGLPGVEARGGGGSGGTTTTSTPSGTTFSTSSTTGAGGQILCVEGSTIECGSDVGACKKGLQTCHDNAFGPCEGAIGPQKEQCNGIDDDCNGLIDEGFNLGAPCPNPDPTHCVGSVITCDGCSVTPTPVETCNGKDDNCNGIIDADCDFGDCQPTLLVTGSTPSAPGCVDFPVEKGSTGTIEYPCGGGPVTATLGSVTFTGSVVNGNVSLSGISFFPDPVGCSWQATHTITGWIPSGQLSYGYVEKMINNNGHPQCYSPCTESGAVQVTWAVGP
jgi:hypothetical protein